MKRDLVGRFHERKHAPGRRMKLAVIRVVGTLKTTNSRTISLVPIVVRSRKRWGISDDRREIFSVDMLRVNHAHVIQVFARRKTSSQGESWVCCCIQVTYPGSEIRDRTSFPGSIIRICTWISIASTDMAGPSHPQRVQYRTDAGRSNG